MNVVEIVNFPLSNVLLNYYICHACGIVDGDMDRAAVGHACRTCGEASKSGQLYFPIQVPVLVDLIQHHFHLPAHSSAGSVVVGAEAHRLTVVVFFSSLVEVLLEYFLRAGLQARGIPFQTIRLLFDEMRFVRPRLTKLFPLVSGETWSAALTALGQVGGSGATDVSSFCGRVARTRNRFLHDGNRWAIPESMPLDCVKILPSLLVLFVALHNRYIARPPVRL